MPIDIPARIAFLKKIHLFYGLEDEDFAVLAEGLDEVSVPKGAVIFEQESKPDGFLFQCGSGQQKAGFCALPGGYRSKDGNFTGMDEFTYLSGATAEEIPDSNKNKQMMIRAEVCMRYSAAT